MKTKKIEVKPEFPSQFGSHEVMVDAEETAKLPQRKPQEPIGEPVREDGQWSAADLPPIQDRFVEMVVCKDVFGFYQTERNRLDNGQSDPNRWATSRVNLK